MSAIISCQAVLALFNDIWKVSSARRLSSISRFHTTIAWVPQQETRTRETAVCCTHFCDMLQFPSVAQHNAVWSKSISILPLPHLGDEVTWRSFGFWPVYCPCWPESANDLVQDSPLPYHTTIGTKRSCGSCCCLQ